MSRYFSGFTKETIQFLNDLGMNNRKEWFEANRTVYMEHVIRPMQQLVMDLSDTMVGIDPLIVTTPGVGKTISRINRDIRFSKDKSPYRNNVWITFKRPSSEWQDCPCFYFEIFPEAYRYGMGYYSASKETMDKLRAVIDNRPALFYEATSFYEEGQPFVVAGDKYKRILKPQYDEELLEWYQRKELYLVCNRGPDDRLFSEALTDDIAGGFKLIGEFYKFLVNL